MSEIKASCSLQGRGEKNNKVEQMVSIPFGQEGRKTHGGVLDRALFRILGQNLSDVLI